MTLIDSAVRSRAVHLLEYLEAVRLLKEEPVRDVAAYRDQRWYADDIPVHPSCRVTATGEAPWLTVMKAQVPPPPPPPEAIVDYLAAGFSDPKHEPVFVDDFDELTTAASDDSHIADPEAHDDDGDQGWDSAEQEALDDYGDPELEAELRSGDADHLRRLLLDYVTGPWQSWATVARPALRTRVLYDDLFDLRQRLQRDSAMIELVWGHALLGWTVDGVRVAHPVVTTQVQLAFDPESGTITIEPDALIQHQMELDQLQGLQVKGLDLLHTMREEFRREPVGPFDADREHLYQRLLNALGQDGKLSEASGAPPAGPTPTITTGWILMVRRRSTMYRRFFSGLREALEAGELNVPAPLVAVVADEPGKLDLDLPQAERDSWQRATERLLMPLPANPEQEAVAMRLATNRGVTVQGPPGTGKTHTIANLISHLVGHGKRVLVTSQKEQALAVLRDKIPEPIRDLSVAVLGSSTTSVSQLDKSVRAISEKAVALDRAPARRKIASLDAQLTSVQREIGGLRTRITASIAREQESYSLGSAPHSPSTLGQWLASHEADLSFIPDPLAQDAQCPLTVAEVADLLHLAAAMTHADRGAAMAHLPAVADLPSSADLASMTAEVGEIRDQLAGTEGALQDRVALERLSRADLTALIDRVDRASKDLAQLEQPWLNQVREELRTAVFAAVWRDQLKAVRESTEELAAWRNQLLGHVVELPGDGLPGKELIGQLTEIRDRLAAGKGIGKAFHRELYRVREACLVDEEPPRTAEDIELCIVEARSKRRRNELTRRWNEAIGRVSGPQLDTATSHPEYVIASAVQALADAFAWEEGGWQALREDLQAAGVRVEQVPTSAQLASLADTLRTTSLHLREKELVTRLDALRKHLADGEAQPGASHLWRNLLEDLTARAWERWGQTVGEVRRLNVLTEDAARFSRLTAQLGAVAPIWASQIAVSDGDPSVIGSADRAAQAWQWRKAETWHMALTSADDPDVLQRQLEDKLHLASKITAELAADSAWLNLAERLTDADRRALAAWVQAINKIGKGTGKYAAHWRAVAQNAMRDAQAAVPVWIMPAHRVVESFDAVSARFDVVIVDESSQCDLFGLAALSIADRAVVVGDDKQISPQSIGTNEAAIHELIEQHISDIPQAKLLDIKTSLYDLAKMRFPGVIMLREHFRCLPDIIEFSNNLSYNGDILPLREQPADPSWRSVIDAPVLDGFRDKGTDTNEAEADFIVTKIAELCEQPDYTGKTFGVISLLGDGQANLIQGKLVDQLGEKEMEYRDIRCGNAYHFQGDERDVMFLSMVVAAGEGRRAGAMTKGADQQRLNVAASRAKDQMWVVRSIAPDELHPDDVRAQLIRHCQNPARVSQEVAKAAASFDSEFERDVYRQIVARGYHVETQFAVGRYRIDLVVKGRQRRLAVELDGDAYHGPDRAEADRSRQAILERLGWTFHRIRGSAYYRDPAGALSGLWSHLDSLDIQPVEATQ